MPAKPKTVRTRDEVRTDFESRGVSIRSWALKHRVNPIIAAQVVSGRLKGLRGEAHNVAVLLKMKVGTVERKVAST